MIRIIPIKFRFPISQTSETSVECKIPMLLGEPLVSINLDQAHQLDLSEKEIDQATVTAETAVLTEICIIK